MSAVKRGVKGAVVGVVAGAAIGHTLDLHFGNDNSELLTTCAGVLGEIGLGFGVPEAVALNGAARAGSQAAKYAIAAGHRAEEESAINAALAAAAAAVGDQEEPEEPPPRRPFRSYIPDISPATVLLTGFVALNIGHFLLRK